MLQPFRNFWTTFRRLGFSVRVMLGLLFLNLACTAFEAMAIALLLPIFQILQAGGDVTNAKLTGSIWEFLTSAFAFWGLQISLGLLLALSFVLVLIRQTMNYMSSVAQGYATRQATHHLRIKLFSAFVRAESGLQADSSAGEMVTRLTTETDRSVSSTFSTVSSIGTVLQVLTYLTGLLFLSVPMTLASVILLVLLAFAGRRLFASVGRAGAAASEGGLKLSAFAGERLQRTRLIRLSGTEKAEIKAFSMLSSALAEGQVQEKLVKTRMSLLPEPIVIGFGYLLLYAGGQLLGYSLERLALFVIVLMRLVPIVRTGVNDYNNIMGKWPSVRRINDFLLLMNENREVKGGKRIFVRLDQAIEFKNASFSYDMGAPTLHNVSVAIPARKITALVGPSGAGKSTFVDLLPRLREVSAGCIEFDSVPANELSVQSLRAGIAFVPQQPQIFNISAAEHIRYGKEIATDDEVRNAARLAGALTFIEALPEGFDTLLGENGSRLSGGQRQRLDIARALVRNAPILILDEPTSALDPDAEFAFRDALMSLREQTHLTIIVIAHRLSTISDADQIIVLQQGRVEAVGDHSKLIGSGSWYAEAYRKQMNRDPEMRPLIRRG